MLAVMSCVSGVQGVVSMQCDARIVYMILGLIGSLWAAILCGKLLGRILVASLNVPGREVRRVRGARCTSKLSKIMAFDPLHVTQQATVRKATLSFQSVDFRGAALPLLGA